MSDSLFSARLRALRKQAGLTQQAVADRLSIHRTAYTKYETSGVTPDQHGLMLLAELFGVSVDYLIGRDSTSVVAFTESGEATMKISLQEQQLLSLFRQLPYPEQQALVQQVQKIFRQRNKK